jgi:HEAT repeat protein
MLAIDNAEVRLLACERLGRIGPDAREAEAALQAVASSGTDYVREEAKRALGRIAGKR